MFKKLFAAIAAAGVAVVGFLGGQLQGFEEGVQNARTQYLAAFNVACPYVRSGVPIGNAKTKGSYVFVWDRFLPYDEVVSAFAKNHGITEEQAAECFIKPPVKS